MCRQGRFGTVLVLWRGLARLSPAMREGTGYRRKPVYRIAGEMTSRVENRRKTVVSRWLLGWAFAAPAAIRFDLALFPVAE
jgi:hypothetical protein